MITRMASLMLALLALTAATSCGRDTGQASASPAPTTSNAEPWDPCSIPDDVIRAAGLRAETKSNEPPTDLPAGWKMCSWLSSKVWYNIAIFSMARPYEEVKNNPENREGRDVKVGHKTGHQFRDKYDQHGCDIAIPYGNRTVLTTVLETAGEQLKGDICTEAVAIATQFEKYYR